MKCFNCNKQAVELHEFFYGNGTRKIAILYYLQVPLCRDHHIEEHKKKDSEKWCKLFDLDYEKIAPIMNKPCCYWSVIEKKIMRDIRHKMSKQKWFDNVI